MARNQCDVYVSAISDKLTGDMWNLLNMFLWEVTVAR